MSTGHDSRAIANEILRIAQIKNLSLTIMQLIKLAFFSHGWSLALLNKPLSSELAEAWQYGPVFPKIYYAFPGSGSMAINKRAQDISGMGMDFTESFDKKENEILENVIDGYGKLHAYELSNLTHQEGSPWQKTFTEKGAYSPIPNELIHEYFAGIKTTNV